MSKMFHYFELLRSKETRHLPGYIVGVPDGIRGPVTRVVWANLIRGTRGNLIAKVAKGEPGEGKIVINESFSSFAGKEGGLTLVGITAEVQKNLRANFRQNAHDIKTYFYGKHAEILRYWDDCPSGELITSMVKFDPGEVANTSQATLRLSENLLERLATSSFRSENSLLLQRATSAWQPQLQRIAVALREAA